MSVQQFVLGMNFSYQMEWVTSKRGSGRHTSIPLIAAYTDAVSFRYCNMDFIFASSLRNTQLNKVTVSYDIACQWSVKLKNRLKLLPENLRNTLDNVKIEFAIPKLHINGHKDSCHTQFGLNYHPGVGRTDGEGIIRFRSSHEHYAVVAFIDDSSKN